jgi:hypothetical protein
VLPDEFMAAKLAVLQFDPQATFGEIVATAQRPRTLGRAGLAAGAGWFCGLVLWKAPLTGQPVFRLKRLRCSAVEPKYWLATSPP